jgi:hypothetical protein
VASFLAQPWLRDAQLMRNFLPQRLREEVCMVTKEL